MSNPSTSSGLRPSTGSGHGMTRRRFTRLVLGGIALSVLGGCAPEETVRATPTSTPTAMPSPTKETPSPTPSVTKVAPPVVTAIPTPTPTSSPTPVLLRNENRPGFFIRYYKPFEPVDPNRWTLSVEGLVKSPQALTLPDVQSLPLVSQVSRMKCVECWSAAAKWQGFHLRSLMEIVDPLPEARWLHFYCADDYYESLTLEELQMERVLFVHRMNQGHRPPGLRRGGATGLLADGGTLHHEGGDPAGSGLSPRLGRIPPDCWGR
jgi:DMSO/TMAO reductase YedYZ molybdopterin-dependent catalytic subunit